MRRLRFNGTDSKNGGCPAVHEDLDSGEHERVEARGLFLLLGAAPECGWLPDEVLRDEKGFVLTGCDIPRERWAGGVPPEDLATTVPASARAEPTQCSLLSRARPTKVMIARKRL